MQRLDGRTALVTGSSQGLGKAIAEALAAHGCHVVINAAHNVAKAQAVRDELIAAGHEASCKCFDVSDEQAVAEAFDAIELECGPVDILVNNARLDPAGRPAGATEGQWWDAVMSVALKGAYLCSLAFYERAQKRGWGRIVNVSSVRSFIAAEMETIAYGVSKLGMHGLTRAFAENGAPFGITVNTVAPGMIVTENLEKRLTPEMANKEYARIPLGRGATCEEVADAVLFAIGNAYITGETININGGMYYAP